MRQDLYTIALQESLIMIHLSYCISVFWINCVKFTCFRIDFDSSGHDSTIEMIYMAFKIACKFGLSMTYHLFPANKLLAERKLMHSLSDQGTAVQNLGKIVIQTGISQSAFKPLTLRPT